MGSWNSLRDFGRNLRPVPTLNGILVRIQAYAGVTLRARHFMFSAMVEKQMNDTCESKALKLSEARAM